MVGDTGERRAFLCFGDLIPQRLFRASGHGREIAGNNASLLIEEFNLAVRWFRVCRRIPDQRVYAALELSG